MAPTQFVFALFLIIATFRPAPALPLEELGGTNSERVAISLQTIPDLKPPFFSVVKTATYVRNQTGTDSYLLLLSDVSLNGTRVDPPFIDGAPRLRENISQQHRDINSKPIEPQILTTDDLIEYLTRATCSKLQCRGQDCSLIADRRGCPLCVCPTGSPARGCDRMPFKLYSDLILNGCPNGDDVTLPRTPFEMSTRWYREIDRTRNIDECRAYDFPVCPELDFNLWRSPRTKDECLFYCYNSKDQAQPSQLEKV